MRVGRNLTHGYVDVDGERRTKRIRLPMVGLDIATDLYLGGYLVLFLSSIIMSHNHVFLQYSAIINSVDQLKLQESQHCDNIARTEMQSRLYLVFTAWEHTLICGLRIVNNKL